MMDWLVSGIRAIPAFKDELWNIYCSRRHYADWLWNGDERGRWYCKKCLRWIP